MAKPHSSPAPVAGLPARQAALDLLTLVRGGASFDDALARGRSFEALEGSDRAFARALATAVLRRQRSFDHLIGAYIDRPLPKRAAKAMDILRLTAAQSLIFETPDHASVSTAVALAKSYKETAGYSGLVNAIARKVARQGPQALAALPERIDTPAWMWRAWERAYGPAKARAIAAAHRREAPLDLTVRDRNDLETLAETLAAEIVLERTLRLKNAAPVPSLPGFEEGRWWVQDAAASLPARLLGDVAGKSVFDLCAAPGGKTMQLAAAGAEVTAVDESGPRLKLIVDNLARVRQRAETVKADVLDWTPPRQADAILLDAPCSATGTIRRHPDILSGKSEDDVKALAALQEKMIDRAVQMLKPGGVLVYATCSLQPEEGETQSAAALARHENLARQPVEAAEIGGLAEAVTRDGDMRVLPSMLDDKGGIDGFFAARFVKKS
ncbi:MAG: transcription antitermination factor NusB [Pseudomonadota bacterium]